MIDLEQSAIDACGRIRSRDDAIAVLTAAIGEERKRCRAIICAAREGEIDGDLRTLIYMIESGRTVEDILTAK